jgi:integrase
MMRQRSLFDQAEIVASRRPPLDDESERLLRQYAQERAKEGASRQSVLREVSQLRSITRECGCPDRARPLASLFTDMGQIARALQEPSTPISRSTGRARLIAVQRFIRIIGPGLGRAADSDLVTLDALLPVRRSAGWHTTGTLVAGETGRRRRRGPTLDTADLRSIIDAAGESSDGLRNVRDRALVALQCFSGLRIEELVRLRWDDLDTNLTDVGYYGLTASVDRAGRRLRLPLPGPAGEALNDLRSGALVGGAPASGSVFKASGRSDRSISYRGARKVLVEACRRAGLPPVTSADLRAGCAHWLRSQGLSDHEVAMVLGLARVRSVDRLLSRHAALDAQRRVREQVSE